MLFFSLHFILVMCFFFISFFFISLQFISFHFVSCYSSIHSFIHSAIRSCMASLSLFVFLTSLFLIFICPLTYWFCPSFLPCLVIYVCMSLSCCGFLFSLYVGLCLDRFLFHITFRFPASSSSSPPSLLHIRGGGFPTHHARGAPKLRS